MTKARTSYGYGPLSGFSCYGLNEPSFIEAVRLGIGVAYDDVVNERYAHSLPCFPELPGNLDVGSTRCAITRGVIVSGDEATSITENAGP